MRAAMKKNLYLRRGAVAVYVAISMSVMLGLVALSVDMSMLYATKSEMQRAADAGAMSGAWRLLDESRIGSEAAAEYVNSMSRLAAIEIAAANTVLGDAPVVYEMSDLQLGVWDEVNNTLTWGGTGVFNAVAIDVHRDAAHNGSIAMMFATALGTDSTDLSVRAVAGFADSIVGFNVTEESGNAQLLPFALHVDSWNALLSGAQTTGDHYSYDPDSGVVSSGSDGKLELNLYPGAGDTQLPPGNFGTVDIGSNSNSSNDIARQILYGVNESDLSYFGGQIEIPINLNGDTGLSAGFKDELEDIKGMPRTIPIFDSVGGNGNNAQYHVIAWAGIRIVHVKLTGKMTSKQVIIQPAYVVDPSAVSGSGGQSTYVYRPVQLVE